MCIFHWIKSTQNVNKKPIKANYTRCTRHGCSRIRTTIFVQDVLELCVVWKLMQKKNKSLQSHLFTCKTSDCSKMLCGMEICNLNCICVWHFWLNLFNFLFFPARLVYPLQFDWAAIYLSVFIFSIFFFLFARNNFTSNLIIYQKLLQWKNPRKNRKEQRKPSTSAKLKERCKSFTTISYLLSHLANERDEKQNAPIVHTQSAIRLNYSVLSEKGQSAT